MGRLLSVFSEGCYVNSMLYGHVLLVGLHKTAPAHFIDANWTKVLAFVCMHMVLCKQQYYFGGTENTCVCKTCRCGFKAHLRVYLLCVKKVHST